MSLSLGLGLALTRNKGGRFDLTAFMAGQTDGFWYDFAKTDRQFQENVGPTPADDPNEVIGLALSQRLWAGQTLAQVVANQTPTLQDDFSSYADTAAMVAAGWDKRAATSGTVTLSAGAFRFTSAAAGLSSGAGKLVSGFTVGRCYQLTGRIRMVSGGGSVSLGLRNSDGGGGSSMVIAAPTVAGTSFEQVTAYWVATQTTAHVALIPSVAAATAELDDIRISEVSRYGATQATTNYKPKFQSSGAAFDGADDYLATNYAAAAGANFVMLPKVTVPSTLSALKVLVGTLDASSYRFYLGITATGQLSGRIGGAIVETTSLDLRNGVHDIGMWTDGTTIFLYVDGVVVASGALSGVIPTSAWNIGALNNNGTPTSFFGGSFKAVLAGRQALTTTQANKICAAY